METERGTETFRVGHDEQKKKKITLSMDERLKVLDELKTFNITTIARKYNVHPQTISRIKHSATKVMEFMDKGKLQQSRRRIRPSLYDSLEKNLMAWVAERRLLGDKMTNAVLLRKATQLRDSTELVSSFKVSKGWLDGFKKRHNVQIFREPGKRLNADKGLARKFCDNSATRRDLNNLAGDPDTGEDIVHLTSTCAERIKSETTEEADEGEQEDEEVQESTELQESAEMHESIKWQESKEGQENTEMQESTEVEESIEVEETKIVPESTEVQQSIEAQESIEVEETKLVPESTEAQESKRVELLYLFQRLEQHVAREEPFIQNIFKIFKDHFLAPYNHSA